MPEASETSWAIVERERPWRASWSIQRCQSISVISPAKRSPNSGRTLYCQRRRMLAIVVSEYGLPRAAAPADPAALDAVEPLVAERRRTSGRASASSARWSAPLASAPSQTSTSPRSLRRLAPDRLAASTGSRRRPRQDGLQRQRASASA